MTRLAILLGALALLTPVEAYDDDASVEEARQAFRKLGETHDGLRTLEARYVQERTSLLTTRPITSSGKVSFRKQPGCLIFRAEIPSATVIRLDEKMYEVYRVEKKQLERFAIAGQEWPRTLFQTFSHKIQELEKSFRILGSKTVGEGDEAILLVRLEPIAEKVKERLTGLRIGIRKADSLVTRIAYSDAQGDEVEIRLEKIVINGEVQDSRFEMKTAPGTQVIVHAEKKQGGP